MTREVRRLVMTFLNSRPALVLILCQWEPLAVVEEESEPAEPPRAVKAVGVGAGPPWPLQSDPCPWVWAPTCTTYQRPGVVEDFRRKWGANNLISWEGNFPDQHSWLFGS